MELLKILENMLDEFLYQHIGDCIPAVPETWVDSNPHSDLFD